MKPFGVCLGCALACMSIASLAHAETSTRSTTFYKDVLPILQDNCQDCHRPGGRNTSGMVAPMSLMTFEEARPWAKAMQRAVESRYMPPWNATPETSKHFINPRLLSDPQIATIVDWVEQGARPGAAEDAPAPRAFADEDGWIIGQPDLVVTMPEPYRVPDEAVDDQPYISFFITEDMLPEARWLKAIEYKPNCDIVHHLTGYMMVAPEQPGRDSEFISLGGIASGSEPTVYPEGFGNVIRPGSELILSIHYHKEAGPQTAVDNQVSVGLKFYPKDAEVTHKLTWTRIANMYFEIPPNASEWQVGAAQTFDRDVLLTSMNPHMHYRGKDAKYVAHYPDGTQELLLDVPKYNFEWQIAYRYQKPKFIPAGTRIEVVSHYDNSPERAAVFTELDTDSTVTWGVETTAEMHHMFIGWTYVEPAEVARLRAEGNLLEPTGAGK